MSSRLLALFIPLLGLVNSALLPRGGDVAVNNQWLGHDKIIPLPALPDDDIMGELEQQFSPLLYSWHGCIPYAAVDADGNAGEGLKPTGKSGGDCRDFKQAGQTYTRVGKSHDRFAVLYSYYLPKVMGDAEQHRHHWLTAVVWLAFQKCPDEARSFSPRGISYSTSPGQFDTKRTTTLYVAKDGTGPATHPLVTYDAGQILFPSDVGPSGALSPPLVGWHRLPQRTKDQFNGIKYEHTKVPFSDGNFQAYLDAAYNEAFYDGVSTAMDCGSLDPPQSMIDPDLEDMPPSAEPTAPPS